MYPKSESLPRHSTGISKMLDMAGCFGRPVMIEDHAIELFTTVVFVHLGYIGM